MTIPIDVGTIAATGSGAFALATPIRIGALLALAVAQTLGRRAPPDKRERSVRSNLAAFLAGRFVLDIDGRIFTHPDEVVVCAGSATVRFFSTERGLRRLPTH